MDGVFDVALLPPLDQTAQKINTHLVEADKADKVATDARLHAGHLLLQAQQRIQSGEARDETGKVWRWEAWCRQHITRSLRDIRRLIALVKPGDQTPEQRREKEKGKNRTTKRISRMSNRDRTVSPVRQSELVESVS